MTDRTCEKCKWWQDMHSTVQPLNMSTTRWNGNAWEDVRYTETVEMWVPASCCQSPKREDRDAAATACHLYVRTARP